MKGKKVVWACDMIEISMAEFCTSQQVKQEGLTNFKSMGWLLELRIFCPHMHEFCLFILHYNWIWWWCNARIYLSTISPLMHVMIYVLIYSRTSKGLSLGELIRAFHIIIFAPIQALSRCFLNVIWIFLHVLECFWGLSYKVPVFGI